MNKNKKMLITRPDHDDVTSYLYAWGRKVVDVAKERNIEVFDLKREKANRKAVRSFITKRNPKLLIFNGHGDEETISGYQNEVLVKCNRNEGLLRNRIIYSISCRSAEKLGG